MLGRRTDELPVGDWIYEPKWDGFRCLAFRSGNQVELRSRHDRPLERYFPELVAGLRALPSEEFVLDGEIVVPSQAGLDFEALLARVHPAASRVERLSRETPAELVAFDLIARGGADLRDRPFRERRLLLAETMGDPPRGIRLTPATEDPAVAADWLAHEGGGIDGVMAKPGDLRYQPGARAMLKVKREHTADCVVAGFRMYVDKPRLSSLLLGLYDDAGELRHIGVAQSFTRERRRQLLDELAPLRVPLAGHPWENGFLMGGGSTGRLAGAAGRWSPREMALDWVPLKPERVCEVAYDQLDRMRLRHPARFRRWRPDRKPRSCRIDQWPRRGGSSPAADTLVSGPASSGAVTGAGATGGEATGAGPTVPDLTNLDRVLWPAAGFSKGDMLAYYEAVAPALLPHLVGRPLTLGRFPDEVDGPGFATTECRGRPEWMRTVAVPLRSGQVREQCVVDDLRSLLWVANLGSIELHAFPSRPGHLEEPAFVVLDLDPGPGAGLADCCRVALWLRQTLADEGLQALPKTSGGLGLHLYVPLAPGHGFPEAKALRESRRPVSRPSTRTP